MKNILIILLFVSNVLTSQTCLGIKAYEETDTFSFYKIINYSWIAFEDPSYISGLPIIIPIAERRIKLIDGEGEHNMPFNLCEAKVNLKYPIARGRESGWGIWRRMRATLNYTPNFRMNLDGSKPLTPTNQEIGLGGDVNIYASDLVPFLKDKIRHNNNFNFERTKDVSFVNFNITAAHYSNGQLPGFYYSVNGEKRNDYKKGDFSTNYLRFTLIYGKYYNDINKLKIIYDPNLAPSSNGKRNHSMWQIGVSYQKDGNWPGGFTREQIHNYGKDRISIKYDHRFGPRHVYNIFGKPILKNYHNCNGEKIRIYRIIDHHVLIKGSYILGNLDDFTPYLKSSVDNKYRFNFEAIWESVYYRYRTIGFFMKYYYGRDYINIRFDDIVHVYMVGITASLNKYRAPYWTTSDSLDLLRN